MKPTCTWCAEPSAVEKCERCESNHESVAIVTRIEVDALYRAAKRLRALAQAAHLERERTQPLGVQLNRTCVCGRDDTIYKDDLCREAEGAWRVAVRLHNESRALAAARRLAQRTEGER